MLLSKDNPGILYAPDIAQICSPLFANTPIRLFHWSKIFHNGDITSLGSDANWHHYFWQKNFYNHSIHFYQEGHHLLKVESNYQQEMKDFATLFNFDNKFEVVIKVDDGYELLGVAGQFGDDRIVNFYLQNIDFLYKFRFYFKEQAALLIQKALDTLNIIKPENRLNLDSKVSPSFCSPELEVKKYFIRNEAVYLTSQEMACLLRMLKGESAKLIAISLGISPRTVEKHIVNCKNKLNCRYKDELIEFAKQNGLGKLIPAK